MLKTRKLRLALTALLVIPLAGLFTTACTVEKTQEGEMPDVDVQGGQLPKYDVDVHKTQEGKMPDVDVHGGNLPKYDVDPAEVEVGIEKKEMTVPDIDINKKKIEVPVPDVNVTPGNDTDDSVEVAPGVE